MHLESNTSEELVGLLSGFASDTELFSDGFAQFLVGNHQLFLDLFLNDVLLQEFLECFRNLTSEKFLD